MRNVAFNPYNLFLLLSVLCSSPISYSQQYVNSWGQSEETPLRGIGDRPVQRGYSIPTITGASATGADLRVEIFHAVKNDPVSVWLQAAVHNGKNQFVIIPLQHLSDFEATNPDSYKSVRNYKIDYRKINAELKKLAPQANLQIGPGTTLFVYTNWAKAPGAGHQWGGVARGGAITLPGTPSSPEVANLNAKLPRPTELDLAFPIKGDMANQFNSADGNVGLKRGGQIRSRLEGEGKFQIDIGEEGFDEIRKRLFEIAQDRTLANKIFGNEWSIKVENRYMQRDSSGQLILDEKGFPIPDPMVDTYYDNADFDAAKNDEAIRYRWTEGNQTGAWNYKPGITDTTDDGLVYRIEYGVDTTDDKPETVAKFAESDHPLNPFKRLRNISESGKATDFFKPAAKLTDYRYKFLLEHRNGLKVEVSLDDVRAESLRPGVGSGPKRFVQVEMDIDHLATRSNRNSWATGTLKHIDLNNQSSQMFLSALDENAFFDGRPVMHDIEDIGSGSALRLQRKADFDLATEAIVKIREDVLGDKWMPAPQKYAFAAYALEFVDEKPQSASMQHLFKKAGLTPRQCKDNLIDVVGQ